MKHHPEKFFKTLHIQFLAFNNKKKSQVCHESAEGNQDKTGDINKPNSDPNI